MDVDWLLAVELTSSRFFLDLQPARRESAFALLTDGAMLSIAESG